MKRLVTVFAVSAALLCLALASASHAALNRNPGANSKFGPALKKRQANLLKMPDPQATNMYSAWGANMANMIEHGVKEGVVVKKEGEYADGKIKVDGVGNVAVEDGARVNGPIINMMEIESGTTVIIQEESGGSRMPGKMTRQ